MDKIRSSASNLDGMIPYDPKYLPADAFMSANENPRDISKDMRTKISRELAGVEFNRYPDPLANDLRDMIASANGLDREYVLIGNGGDELLFNTALTWGGPGRTFLNFPPTFSVYETNALLTNTNIIEIPRIPDDNFALDEPAVLNALKDPSNDIAYTIVASPNNPTGLRTSEEFLVEMLNATDALVMVDEAYFEFSRFTMRPYLEQHKNLVILRTFSKAFSLAGLRIGYILANPEVIREYIKVRQPYSVDAVSQAIARVIYENRAEFEPGIKSIISERDRLIEAMRIIPGITAYPSESNWILFAVENAPDLWQYLYDRGILIRDLSSTPMLDNMLRVSIGTKEQNDNFLDALKEYALYKERIS